MSRPRTMGTTKIAQFRLPVDLLETLDKEARLAGKTRSEVMRQLVLAWLRRRRGIELLKGGDQ